MLLGKCFYFIFYLFSWISRHVYKAARPLNIGLVTGLELNGIFESCRPWPSGFLELIFFSTVVHSSLWVDGNFLKEGDGTIDGPHDPRQKVMLISSLFRCGPACRPATLHKSA